MSAAAPHCLLFSETQRDDSDFAGSWSFVLERVDGSGRIEVSDREPDVRGERLKLLAVVRGLEALEQPSRVTLITANRFIGRGIRSGISLWKDQGWQWERFGVMVAVKNSDLWKRIDHATLFHNVDCRVWSFGQYLKNRNIFSPRLNGTGLNGARFEARTQPKVRSGPMIRPPRKLQKENALSWTELATVFANQLLPVRNPQAYGCA